MINSLSRVNKILSVSGNSPQEWERTEEERRQIKDFSGAANNLTGCPGSGSKQK